MDCRKPCPAKMCVDKSKEQRNRIKSPGNNKQNYFLTQSVCSQVCLPPSTFPLFRRQFYSTHFITTSCMTKNLKYILPITFLVKLRPCKKKPQTSQNNARPLFCIATKGRGKKRTKKCKIVKKKKFLIIKKNIKRRKRNGSSIKLASRRIVDTKIYIS